MEAAKPTTIEIQVKDEFDFATTEWSEGVTAIRLRRFDGAVMITFDRPQRVRLSEQDWADTYISRASCRNILKTQGRSHRGRRNFGHRS